MADVILDYCPKCGLTGEDIESCGLKGGAEVMCPEPLPVDFSTVAVLKCGPCGKTRAVSVNDVMHADRRGTAKMSTACPRMECMAQFVLPPAAPAKAAKKG